MKKLIFSIAVLLMFVELMQAQTAYTLTRVGRTNGVVYYVDDASLDSATTYASQEIDLSAYDKDAKVQYSYKATTADSIHITIKHYIRTDSDNWVLEGTIATVTTTTATNGTYDITGHRAGWHKFYIVNDAGSSANTGFDFGFYATKNAQD